MRCDSVVIMRGDWKPVGWMVPVVASVLSACATAPPRPQASFEDLPALRGDYFPLVADQSRRQYHIHVRLPESYDPSKAKTYPVVYVLDGDSLFPLLAPTHLFLTNDEGIPDAIVVGIGYGSFDPAINKRDVDFAADGAPQFQAFLKYQLIPQIERGYRADASRRVILGQSRAGYFVLWSAVQDPNLFWASIASNFGVPSAREALFQAPPVHPAGRARVAIVSGTRDTDARMQNGAEWVRYWTSQPDAPWAVRHFIIQGGTHAASIGQAYRDVMVWLFKE